MNRALVSLLYVFVVFPLTLGLASTDQSDDKPLSDAERLGQRIYREGILPNGSAISAYVQGDVPISGNLLACANCHRRSGFGSSEGGMLIPAVTPSSLFSDIAPQPRLLSTRNHTPVSIRSAYTDKTLALAIQKGVNADGKQLDNLMPRFALSTHDTDLLIAYLKRLSTKPDPGVTDSHIHIATIIAGEIDAKRRDAMLEIFEKFIRDKNAGTRNESGRAQRAPWHKEWPYEAYRKWKLHVWALNGSPQSWPRQLEEYYKQQAVFAIVGGTGNASWMTVYDFCSHNRIPCILPSTDLPYAQGNNFYSVYYSKGIMLEAETLATYLRSSHSGADPLSILQIIEPTSTAEAAAQTLSSELSGEPRFKLSTFYTNESKSSLLRVIERQRPNTMVFWTMENHLKSLTEAPPALPRVKSIFLSSTMLKPYSGLPSEVLSTPTFLLQPFDISDNNTSMLRIRAWMRSKSIEVVDMRLQADAFTAITLAADAMKHIKSNFSRDYFMEKLEHMIDDAVTTSVYPRLSLAPRQRFASKGCYIIDLPNPDSPATQNRRTWVVP